MSDKSRVDVRGRDVVWTAGSLNEDAEPHSLRRLLRRLGVLTAASVLAAGLLVVVATWSVISPVGATPNTPLWMAPPDFRDSDHLGAAFPSPTAHLAPTAHPTPTAQPAPTATRTSTQTPVARRSESGDDHGGARRERSGHQSKREPSDRSDDSSSDSSGTRTSGSGKSGAGRSSRADSDDDKSGSNSGSDKSSGDDSDSEKSGSNSGSGNSSGDDSDSEKSGSSTSGSDKGSDDHSGSGSGNG